LQKIPWKTFVESLNSTILRFKRLAGMQAVWFWKDCK